jgi:hypothetical protein
MINKLSQYNFTFQIKVIYSLLHDKVFLQQVMDILSEDDFENEANAWIVTQIKNYYYTYNTNPTIDVLKIEIKKIDNEVLKVAIVENLREVYKVQNHDDAEYIKTEFITFCKNQQLKKALLTSVDLLGMGQYDDIRRLIDNALKSGEDKDLGHEYNVDTESRFRAENRTCIPTPWPVVNNLLNGGLGSGELGIVTAGPGGAKTWHMIAIGAHAIECGFTVLHYTLELSDIYVGRRYDAYFTEISVNDVVNYKDKAIDIISSLPGQLIVKSYPPKRATLFTIENHLRKCIGRGIKPDLVIIDYPDLLKPAGKNIGKESIDDIYVETRGLAGELQIPIWIPSQVNRAGAKDAIIEGDKIAGSYDKLMIGDFVMSVSRLKKDKVNGTGRHHIIKSRFSFDGMTYRSKIDTSTGRIEINPTEIDEDEIEKIKDVRTQKGTDFDNDDKSFLHQKFMEFTTSTNN